jgi:hypothetical protein
MDYSFEATYYRTALLLGLTRGEAVSHWADEAIARDPEPPPALIDVASARPSDLSELRHALWPLSVEPVPQQVFEAILGQLSRDLESKTRSVPDTLTILRQMRSMLRMPAALYAALNGMLVERTSSDAPDRILAEWLRGHAGLHSSDSMP